MNRNWNICELCDELYCQFDGEKKCLKKNKDDSTGKFFCWKDFFDHGGVLLCVEEVNSIKEWNSLVIPKSCIYRAEYCLKEWNNEEKTEEKS